MSIAKGIALITGSAQGIGRSIALRLAKDGFDIALNDVSSKRDQLRTVASDIEKIGRRTHLVSADVSVDAEVRGMVQGVAKELGGLDVMVANAGVAGNAMFKDITSTRLDAWDRIMSVNARGTFLCYRYAAEQMIAQGRGGRIIGACSISGMFGFPLSSAYGSSKFLVRGLTQIAAQELGRHKITVNSYAPGVIQTPMVDEIFHSASAEAPGNDDLIEWTMARISGRPIKHEGQPEDVAGLVSFLVSEEARFITGQCITIDGGVVMS